MSERGAYKLYSYVLAHDSGFVPNSFGSYYTLACCKPKIRKNTKIGDWIAGTGSKRNVGNVRLIYVIGVTKKITFEQYANDGRFTSKIPSQGVIEEGGDNVYYRNANGMWIQRVSYHAKEHVAHDLSESIETILPF